MKITDIVSLYGVDLNKKDLLDIVEVFTTSVEQLSSKYKMPKRGIEYILVNSISEVELLVGDYE